MWIIYVVLFVITRTIETFLNKKLLIKEDALVFSFVRAVAGLFFWLLLIFIIPLDISLNMFLLIYLISFLACFGIYTRSMSYKIFEISYVSPLLNLIPLLVLIFAVIFLQEKLSYTKIVGILLIIISAYFINLIQMNKRAPYRLSTFFNKGFVFIFIAALLFAIIAIFDKISLTSVEPITFIFYLSLFFTINFLVIILIKEKWQESVISLKKNYSSYFIIGILLIFSQLGQYTAISMKEVSIVVPLLMTHSLLVIIGSKKFFQETNIIKKFTFSVLLIVGITLILY